MTDDSAPEIEQKKTTPRMLVKRMWFPTHGRLNRRVEKRSEQGWSFRGCVASGLLGLVLVHLVYEARA